MDAMVVIGGVGAVIFAVALIFWFRRRERIKHMGELALLPGHVVNPRLYAHLKTIRAWELIVAQPASACAWARETKNSRFLTELSVPVPIAGCGKACTCRYQAITENRRRQRRADPLDQVLLGLGKPEDANRRGQRGRRKGDKWSGDQR